MITGLNQNLNIQGRSLHLQTEVLEGDPVVIRTVVYQGGTILATRQGAVPDAVGQGGENAIRELMQRQHELIGKAVLERSSRSWAPKQAEAGQDPPAPRRPYTLTMGVAPAGGGSSPALEPQLKEALKIRRGFTRFKARVIALGTKEPEDRLEDVGALLSAMSRWELFHRVRVDEQLRFSLLEEQVATWLSGARGTGDAEKIWAEILVFLDYLMEINYRAELLEYDRRVLSWALGQAEKGPLAPETVKKLAVLFGRDPELDRLLGKTQPSPTDVWVPELRRVRDSLA